jgi:DNA-binding MarR family transcriptional regulator
VLRIVGVNPGISISELAEKMPLHVTTAEGYAKRLLKLGYITLEEDRKDRRRKIMRSTPQGMDVVKKVPPVLNTCSCRTFPRQEPKRKKLF